jgi:alkylation response protein AidB-like acyl-CoA dehydrogenase
MVDPETSARRERLARELAPSSRGPSAFQRLAPGCFASEDPLGQLEALVDEPPVMAELDALEETRAYPDAVVERLRTAGLGSLLASDPDRAPASSRATVPHGAALSALLARRSSSLAVAVGVNYLGLLPIYTAASPELLREICAAVRGGAFASLLLTELDHGSNILRTAVRAERAPGDASDAPYLLSGEKNLINGASRHEVLTVLARTAREPPGSPRGGKPGDLSLFVVMRGEGMRSLPRWRTLPAHGADISGVAFDGAVVPACRRLGREGDGFDIVQRTLTATRGGVSAFASGAASGSLDLARAYVGRRDVYGTPIRTLGAIVDHVLRMEALDLTVAATCLRAILHINALGEAASLTAAVAKHACSLLAEEAVAEGRRALGSRALLAEGRYERFVRDVVLFGAFDGSSHLMLDQIQWRLTQLAAGIATQGSDDLAEAARAYATPPRPIVEVCRLRGRVFLPSLRGRIAALASVSSPIDLASLAVVARALGEVVNRLREAGRWEVDQGLRFDAAEVLALHETVIALVELADPDRRRALGMPPAQDPDGRHASIYRLALGMLGARAASRLRAVAARGGVTTGEDLGGAEAALWTLAEGGRRALLARDDEIR